VVADTFGMDSLPLTSSHAGTASVQSGWLRAARQARLLSWVSLVWMSLEGALGVLAGARAGSISLLGWGLGSAIEAFAALIVIWRFTGSRVDSETAERRAGRAVAVSFFLLAPYLLLAAVRAVIVGDHPSISPLGITVTGSSVVLMPALGLFKQRLGRRLGSGATVGEGAQNLLCAAQGGAVLVALLLNTAVGLWWFDDAIAAALAAQAVREGRRAWRGEGCCVAHGPADAHGHDDCCESR
jgi:divalent metal cation (Fe/Co/Zn/Cd) transporter